MLIKPLLQEIGLGVSFRASSCFEATKPLISARSDSKNFATKGIAQTEQPIIGERTTKKNTTSACRIMRHARRSSVIAEQLKWGPPVEAVPSTTVPVRNMSCRSNSSSICSCFSARVKSTLSCSFEHRKMGGGFSKLASCKVGAVKVTKYESEETGIML